MNSCIKLLRAPWALLIWTFILWSAVASAQTLQFRDAISQETNLAGVTHAAWSPDGAHLYAVADQDHTLMQLIPDVDGSLTFGQVLRDGVGGVDGLEGAIAVAVSPNGDQAKGSVVTHEIRSPDGRFVYQITGPISSETPARRLFVLRIDPDTNQPDPGTALEIDMSRPYSDLEISQDGASLYATDVLGNIYQFSLDSETGGGTLVDPWEELPTLGQEWRVRIALPNGNSVVVQVGTDGMLRTVEGVPLGGVNVAVSKSLISEFVAFGESLATYAIVVANNSAEDASAITLRDALPEGATSMSWSVVSGTGPGNTSGTGPIEETFPLQSGSEVFLEVGVNSPANNPYVNEATIAGDDHAADNRSAAPSPAVLDILSQVGFEVGGR